jgi:hypothetical protein
MMTDQTTMANIALSKAATRSQVVLTDTTQEAIYINLLYNPLRDFLLREGDYDWSLANDAAVEDGVGIAPWVYRYQYPAAAVRVRQPIPLTYDALDPMPIEFNPVVLGSNRYVITKIAISRFIYTQAPAEEFWDAMFVQAFTDLLASALVFSLENRIEAKRELLQEAISFAGIANLRDG